MLAWVLFDEAAQGPARADERFLRARVHASDVVRIEAGTFVMGSSDPDLEHAIALCEAAPEPGIPCDAAAFADEQPAHRVQLPAFAIDRAEVSRGDYQRCIERGQCAPRARDASDVEPAAGDLPVVLVSAREAERYCRSVGGRLPTEAEWERAASGGAPRRFPWGNAFNDRLANHESAIAASGPAASTDPASPPSLDRLPRDGFAGLAPTRSLPDGRSAQALFHAAGNVWELTADRYDAGAYARAAQLEPVVAPFADPREPVGSGPVLRVIRGGAFDSPPHALRVAERSSVRQDEARANVGFRCAYDVLGS